MYILFPPEGVCAFVRDRIFPGCREMISSVFRGSGQRAGGGEIVFVVDVLVLRLLMKQDGGFHLRFELKK